MENPLKRLATLGQSVWYDNLSRALLQSGELKTLIEEDGVSGVTTNPSIFENAIATSKIYDTPIHELVDEGRDVQSIYEGLVVQDVRDACDLLTGVYEKSEGMDGYVSLEVSPDLAYDAKGTVAEAKRLFSAAERPNLMIKVPGTRRGIPAVKELIASGVNVNVTLIFSLAQYRDAAQAYIEGLEERAALGASVTGIASVASFFVSRLDTALDERLDELLDPASQAFIQGLKGRAAIANAKLAYELFLETFQGPRFEALAGKGARPQRVLWASTSVKNALYNDTLYADALIGPHTVNTLPPVTLEAFRLHGNPECRLQEGLNEARSLFEKLNELGIPVDKVMGGLLEKGVAAFSDSYRKLLEGIAAKRRRLLRGWGHRSASLGELQELVDRTLDNCDTQKAAERLWAGDPSVWGATGTAAEEIGRRLGWLHVPAVMKTEIEGLREFAEESASEGFTDAVLLGMGGSSLAAEVFQQSFGTAKGFLRLHVLDTTVPGTILELDRSLDLKRTMFIVSSKSGGTIEVTSLYKYFRKRIEDEVGDEAGGHFVAITDPGTGLGKLASEARFRKTFLNPPDIGGRFSALSYFGLAPAALIGADLERLLMRALQSAESSVPAVPALEGPGMWLGVIMGESAKAGIDKLTLVLSPPVESFGLWLEQLVAESLGKEGKGVIPIHGEPPGEPETYGKDRLFIYLRIDGDTTHDAFVSKLERAGHKVVTLRLHGPYDIGREMFRWEFATAVAGHVLNVNPFDQPNVQESKDLTGALLRTYQEEGRLPDGPRVDASDPDLPTKLRRLFVQVREGDYVGFNAYLTPTPAVVALLQEMRSLIRDKFRTATTLGFGPRFLHSTGQIHKGGPNSGIFLQITADDHEDAAIPGENFSFGTLKQAQALGDFQALERRGRRLMRFHMPSDAGLSTLRDALGQL